MTTTVIDAITNIWTKLVSWMLGIIPDFFELFYNATDGLTFIGTMAVVFTGIGLVLLVWGIITNFIRLRA